MHPIGFLAGDAVAHKPFAPSPMNKFKWKLEGPEERVARGD